MHGFLSSKRRGGSVQDVSVKSRFKNTCPCTRLFSYIHIHMYMHIMHIYIHTSSNKYANIDTQRVFGIMGCA